MTITVRAYVPDIAAVIATPYDKIRLYSATSPTAAFTNLVATEALVADTRTYTFADAAGTVDTWYVTEFFDTATVATSDQSSPFQPLGGTLEEVRKMAAKQAASGFESTSSGNGTTTSLVDVTLRDDGLSDKYLNSSWIDRYPIVTADRVRRLATVGFNPDTGALAPLRAWSVAPVADEPYTLYALLPPIKYGPVVYSWDDAIRDGLTYCWYNDEVVVADSADADTTNQITLDQVPWLEEDRIRAVYARRYNADGDRFTQRNLTKQGRFWQIRDVGFGRRVLMLSGGPLTGEQVVVSCIRQPTAPYKDADIIEIDTELAAMAATMAAYEYLNRVTPTKGQYQGEYEGAYREWWRLYKPFRPADAIVNS